MNDAEELMTTFCLACNTKLGYPPALVGRKIRCPACGDSRVAPDLFEGLPTAETSTRGVSFPRIVGAAVRVGLPAIGCAIVAAIATSGVYNAVAGVHSKKWTSDRGVQYVDYYQRGTETPVHRSVTVTLRGIDGRPVESLAKAGPMAGETKPHGRWIEAVATDVEKMPPREIQFYWYGEPVTEGEWHLRNDRR